MRLAFSSRSYASPIRFFRRSRHDGIVLSSRVRNALDQGMPVVCLESTIITHGMAYPDNLAMARRVEQVIESNGAVPATIAILNGVAHVGLLDNQLQALAEAGQSARKVSRRDLAKVIADKSTGGTTVSATMILAKAAGIQVFVTGGIGGVHRYAEDTMDISNDLNELSRNDVTVVCAGPKAILDIPRTLEYLETMGVSVVTLGQQNLPAFYSRDSGIRSPQTCENVHEVAQMIAANQSMQLGSSILVCVPIPENAALPSKWMNKVISEAIKESKKHGITGKDSTPYLLAAVSKATQGKSLEANIALVLENARVGAQIACELARLSSSNKVDSGRAITAEDSLLIAESLRGLEEGFDLEPSISISKDHELLVIGGVAMDTSCTIHGSSDIQSLLHTSNPGTVARSIGGVAGNIARAAALTGVTTKLASLLGASDGKLDATGQEIDADLQSCGITTALAKVERARTASYTCIQAGGKLMLGVADMSIFDYQDQVQALLSSLSCDYKAIVVDGNLLASMTIADLKRITAMTPMTCFEPTSVAKSKTLFRHGEDPSGIFNMVTPNIHELSAMYTAARDIGLFETDSWWHAINALNINQDFRNKAEHFLRNSPLRALKLSEVGAIQQCLHLLPICQNIYLTLGSHGVLSVHLDDIESDSSMKHDGQNCTVTMIHHSAELATSVVNDTGCGDTFTGVLVSHLIRGNSITRLFK